MDGSRPSPDTAGLQDREKATSVVFGCNGPNRQRQRPGRGRGAAGSRREDPARSLSTGGDGPQGQEGRGGSWWRHCRGPLLSSCGLHQACVQPRPAARTSSWRPLRAWRGARASPAPGTASCGDSRPPPLRRRPTEGGLLPARVLTAQRPVSEQPRHRTRLLTQKQACAFSPFSACFECS